MQKSPNIYYMVHVVLNVRRKVLQCRIINKNRRFRGKVVLIPRIRLLPNTETLPVPLKRLQFPVRLAFAMTINKSQEQSVEHMGINLQISVFSHRQLYVAFSRCTSPLNISVLLSEQSQESRSITNGHLLICDWYFRILKGSKMRSLDSDKRCC